MLYRASTIEISLAGERETWRMAKEHLRLGLRLWRAALWSRIGTRIQALRDALDMRGFYTMGHRVDVLVVRCYERCVRICDAASATKS